MTDTKKENHLLTFEKALLRGIQPSCSMCAFSTPSPRETGRLACYRYPPPVGADSGLWVDVTPDFWCGEWLGKPEGE